MYFNVQNLSSSPPSMTAHSLFPPVSQDTKATPPPIHRDNEALKVSHEALDQLPNVTSGSIVQIPTVEV